VLAPYSAPAEGYLALHPVVELGDDLAVALYAVGIRAGTPGGYWRRGWALKLHGGQVVRLDRASESEARRAAVDAAVAGPVELCRAVAQGRTVVYRRVERVQIMPMGEALSDDQWELVSRTGALVAKALDLRFPADFRAFTRRLGNQLMQADRAHTLPHIRRAVEALDFDWGNMTAAKIDRAFREARKAMRGIAEGPILPVWSKKVTVQLESVIKGVRKILKTYFTPRIGLAFSQPDRQAVGEIAAQQGWFLRDALGRRADALTNKGRKIVSAGLKRGLGSRTIGAQLRAQLPQLWQGYGAGYANVVAANAVSRARSYSELAGYREAGIEYLEVQAMLDERTTEICRFMDGQILEVRACAALQQAARTVSKPEQIYQVTPFMEVKTRRNGQNIIQTRTGTRVAQVLRSGVGGVNDRGKHNQLLLNGKMPKKGVGTPPYHHNCRSLTVPRVEMVQVPRGYRARAPIAPPPGPTCRGTAVKAKGWQAGYCAAASAGKANSSGPVGKQKGTGVTGDDGAKAGKQKQWKPPKRTITLPEGVGGSLEDHQQAILAFRGGKAKVLEFRNPELIESLNGPVLKQLAVTKKWPDGVKYYTYVQQQHVAQLEAQLGKLYGKPMPKAPPVATPPPAPKPKVPYKPKPAPPPKKMKPPPAPKVAPKPGPAKLPTAPLPGATAATTPGALPRLSAREVARSKLDESYFEYHRWLKSAQANKAKRRVVEKLTGRLGALSEGEVDAGFKWLTSQSRKKIPQKFTLADWKRNPKATAARLHDILSTVWNEGYARTDAAVTAMHHAAQSSFGLSRSATPTLRAGWAEREFRETFTPEVRKFFEAYVQSVYEITQEELARQGVKKITVMRGVRFRSENLPKNVSFSGSAEVVELQQYPLAATSVSPGRAGYFANQDRLKRMPRMYQYMEVDAERIYSYEGIGLGTEAESEIIMLGDTDEAIVYSWKGTNKTPGKITDSLVNEGIIKKHRHG